MKSNKLANTIMLGLVSSGLTVATVDSAIAADKKAEKCYGIVKKAKNDCATPKHACAAQATKSGSPQEWMYVLKGNCERIVGGKTKPS